MVRAHIIIQVVCQTSGQWSGAMPKCVRAQGEMMILRCGFVLIHLDKCLDYYGEGLSVLAAWKVLIVWIQPGILICNPTTERRTYGDQ